MADFGPLFPRHVGEKPALPFDSESWAEYEAARRDQYVNVMLPYWQKLVPVYAAALAYPFGDDTGQLQTRVEVCPVDMDAQQNSLLRLFEESKLRMAWRSLAEWYVTQQAYYTDGQRKALSKLEREHQEGSNPLAEIPLYQSYLRASCHQLICMPVSQWDAMFSQTAQYEPGQIDAKTIKRLAVRVARVFNAPPLADVEFLAQSPSWGEPIVWSIGQGGLTVSKSGHGMDDRHVDDLLGEPVEVDRPQGAVRMLEQSDRPYAQCLARGAQLGRAQDGQVSLAAVERGRLSVRETEHVDRDAEADARGDDGAEAERLVVGMGHDGKDRPPGRERAGCLAHRTSSDDGLTCRSYTPRGIVHIPNPSSWRYSHVQSRSVRHVPQGHLLRLWHACRPGPGLGAQGQPLHLPVGGPRPDHDS